MKDDDRRFAPAAQRNRGPILEVLRCHLPSRGLVLEVGSGTGEHVAYFAQELGPALLWQPSDPDPEACQSIDAWAKHQGVPNIQPALALDAAAGEWPSVLPDAILCFNMIHIAPWPAAIGLIEGSARILKPDGMLFLYGPFREQGRHTSPGNAAFDRSLRLQDPRWGVRDLEDVIELATRTGFRRPLIERMPANNLTLIFTLRGPARQTDPQL